MTGRRGVLASVLALFGAAAAPPPRRKVCAPLRPGEATLVPCGEGRRNGACPVCRTLHETGAESPVMKRATERKTVFGDRVLVECAECSCAFFVTRT